MTEFERFHLVNEYIGRAVYVKIDRPVGYIHQKERCSLTYPINYGYIPGIAGGDGEELDVYLLGVKEPVQEYTAKIIGAAYRRNDVEDKLIAAPFGMDYTVDEVCEAISFQEQWYDTDIRISDQIYPHHTVGVQEKADYYQRPGAYIIPENDGKIGLIKSKGGFCFIGGGREKGENDSDCLKREVIEETGYGVKIESFFASAEQYKPDQTDIGYFHPIQNYYIGQLTEKICKPIEEDHELQWIFPQDVVGKMALEMQEWALNEYLKSEK
ncbi:MAG: NUDIX domain-containing protein [Clostridia bacterium]|nr:NUDIX domain-containing protein [Clostridia bacterium]